MTKDRTINITPPVSVYSTYRRLSYTHWYALAEFVDNSTQNYYDHRDKLKRVYGREKTNLKIKIMYDPEKNQLSIADNAHGMDFSEVKRAVTLDSPPPDTSGRCEFGMGLKTAACWFGKKWVIETTKIGSNELFTVSFDVPRISKKRNTALMVKSEKCKPDKHFTTITLKNLYKPIKGRTFGRIKDELSSIYREDLRSGEIEFFWGIQNYPFQTPQFLKMRNQTEAKNLGKRRYPLKCV